MGANDKQVGGDHYRQVGVPQHWDLVAIYGWDYFQGQVVKYLMRWRKKNGIEDLKKAAHYLEKYIEIQEAQSKVADKANADTQRTAIGSATVGSYNPMQGGNG